MSELLLETVQRLSKGLDKVGGVLRTLLLIHDNAQRENEYAKAELLIKQMELDLIRYYQGCRLAWMMTHYELASDRG
jgi:hypothetical protein